MHSACHRRANRRYPLATRLQTYVSTCRRPLSVLSARAALHIYGSTAMEGHGRFSQFLSAGLAIGLIAHRLTHHDPGPHNGADKPNRPGSPSPPNQAVSERRTPRSGKLTVYRLVADAIRHFLEDDCTTMAAALAYYTTFSIAPLLLIIISIVGLVFGRQAVQHDIQNPDPRPDRSGAGRSSRRDGSKRWPAQLLRSS